MTDTAEQKIAAMKETLASVKEAVGEENYADLVAQIAEYLCPDLF